MIVRVLLLPTPMFRMYISTKPCIYSFIYPLDLHDMAGAWTPSTEATTAPEVLAAQLSKRLKVTSWKSAAPAWEWCVIRALTSSFVYMAVSAILIQAANYCSDVSQFFWKPFRHFHVRNSRIYVVGRTKRWQMSPVGHPQAPRGHSHGEPCIA